jgi:hypothetical protein
MKTLWIAALLAAFASASQAQQLALAAPTTPQKPAGRVLSVVGDAEAVSSHGVTRRLAQGDVVREGDTLATGADSHLQLRMADDALLALRPDSRLRLHIYNFVERGAPGSYASMELFVGGLRSITGAIGRIEKHNYLIRGGKSLIGVRGTDHEVFVVDAGTYDRVTQGATYIADERGRVDLEPGETGFAALAGNQPPRRLERAPEFMHVAFQRSASFATADMREDGFGDERRLSGGGRKLGHAHKDEAFGRVRPTLPAQAIGENGGGPGHGNGYGRGGRCGGPCAPGK